MATNDLLSQVQTSFLDGGRPLIGLPLSTQQVRLLLANKLLPLLPYPIAVIRRIQFELKQSSPTAQVYLVLMAPFDVSKVTGSSAISESTTRWLSERSPSPPPPTQPFLVAYLDLIPAGQTQSWVFSTSEIPTDHSPPFSSEDPPPPAGPITIPPPEPTNTPLPLLRLLFTHLLTHLIPRRPTSPSADWLWLRDNKKYLSQPYSPSKVLFGTVHSSLIPFFSLPGQTRRDGRYHKFIIPPLPLTQETDPTPGISQPRPPHGYTLRPLADTDLQTVLDRSPIPRTINTLRSMANVGLYTSSASPDNSNDSQPHGTQCVGWGFLSKDGSISSLHVEAPHRGKGLALVLGQELLRLQSGVFADGAGSFDGDDAACDGNGKWWGAADVEENNVASRRVMEKLGGKVWWGVQWVEIDVGVVLEGLKAL